MFQTKSRIMILGALALLALIGIGLGWGAHAMADKAGLQSTLLGRHLQVLEGWGYVHGNGAIKLTPQGARSMDWD